MKPQCSSKITTDHQVGDEATSLKVIIKQACLAGAYNIKDLQTKVERALLQQARPGYLLASYLLTSPLTTSIKQRTVIVSARYDGRLRYSFAQQTLKNLLHQLAGKSTAQATQVLSHLAGVDKISLHLSGGQSHLPEATTNIFVIVE